MPVYIRKNVSYTPPSIDNIPQEMEDDYVNDPELLRDTLPQPYRMIDKTLRDLIDDSWDVIATREEERLAEARKVQPPQYEYAVCLEGPIPGPSKLPEKLVAKQSLAYATAMCESSDGKYVFIGLPSGLVGLEAMNQQFTGSWEEEGAEITYMKSYTLASQMYLIVTIDDMGIGRLFAFTYNRMFLLKVLNTNPPDSENKTLVSKIEASAEGDYAGIVMENPGSHEMWLEVHKLPRDTWVSDLETIITALKKKEEKKEEAISEDAESVVASELAGSVTDTVDPSVASLPPADTNDQSQMSSSTPGSAPGSGRASHSRLNLYARSWRTSAKKSRPDSAVSGGEPGALGLGTDPTVLSIDQPKDPLSSDYKFGSPQLTMKVKPPPPITGATSSSLQSACQKIDNGDVVGPGHNYLSTQTHIDLRDSVFEHLHDNLIKYLPGDEESTDIQQYPNFHFLRAGRMLPLGLEQASLDGRPTTVAVWWPRSSNLIQYSLIKSSKDVEFKPDLVWPFSCKITCTEVSEDTSLIAIGLENGNVVIWDKYMGTHRGVVRVQDDSAIVQLRFLHSGMYPKDTPTYPPYPTQTGVYLLIMCANSAMYYMGTDTGRISLPTAVSLPVEAEGDTITVVQPFTVNPDMLLTVTHSGKVQIRDCLQGKIICQIKLPDLFELSSPWEPVMALGGQGHALYIKGNRKISEDESEIGSVHSQSQTGTVFVYNLKMFPSLDEHWKIQRTSQPLTVHPVMGQRVDAVLAERISMQGMRKARMQERWSQLKEEVNNIHKLKETARANALARPVVTPGSVGLAPFH